MSCHCLYYSTPWSITWYPGDNAGLKIQLFQADGSPFSLVDRTVNFRVAASDASGAALLWDLSGTEESVLILDAAAGIVLIIPGATLSAALEPRMTYPAALTVTLPGGMSLTFGPGYIETYKQVPTL